MGPHTFFSALTAADKPWWKFWQRPEPEPVTEAFTIYGFDPLTFFGGLFVLVVAASSIYYHPKWFFRGVAESMGWIVGIVALGLVVAGGAAAFSYSLAVGVAAFFVYMVIVLVIMFAFFSA